MFCGPQICQKLGTPRSFQGRRLKGQLFKEKVHPRSFCAPNIKSWLRACLRSLCWLMTNELYIVHGDFQKRRSALKSLIFYKTVCDVNNNMLMQKDSYISLWGTMSVSVITRRSQATPGWCTWKRFWGLIKRGKL